MLIQPYNKQWKNDFQNIKNALSECLTDINADIEHIGSTAIPNLAAKAIIDMDIVYYKDSDFETIKSQLEKLGYLHNGNQGIKDRDVFKRKTPSVGHKTLDTISHHLYVCPHDSDQLERHILFRDYLKTHKIAREHYQNLKFAIAEEAHQDKKTYAMMKEIKAKDFIESILQKAKSSQKRLGNFENFLNVWLIVAFFLSKTVLLAQKDTNSITVKGIHHVTISVQDLDASAAFYKNAFAMQEVERQSILRTVKSEKRSKIQHFDRKKAILRSPNVFFELTEFEGAKNTPLSKMPIEGAGVTHVCYQAPIAQPIYEKVKILGAKMVSRGDKPVDLGGYGIYYAYTREANNIMFEMEHFDKPPFKDPVWVGHVSIVTPDIDRLVAFYTRVLGIRPHRRSDNIKPNTKLDDIGGVDSIRLRGAWFKLDNMQLELWEYQNPKTPTPTTTRPVNEIGYHSIAFEVDNLDNEYQRLTTWKIPFLSKPVVENKQKIVFLRDPDDNLISLNEYERGSAYSIDVLKKLE